jgi:steroid delta-isomerase
MSPQARSARLSAMVQWFETLTPQTLKKVGAVYAAEAHFKDPFNDVVGVQAIEAIYAHMFENLGSPRFEVVHTIEQAQQAFVAWRFKFEWRAQSFDIPGGTHLWFDADGLIVDHIDYWDVAAGLYERLPLLGALLRWLRQRMATPLPPRP